MALTVFYLPHSLEVGLRGTSLRIRDMRHLEAGEWWTKYNRGVRMLWENHLNLYEAKKVPLVHFEPSLGALSLRSGVMKSMKILALSFCA